MEEKMSGRLPGRLRWWLRKALAGLSRRGEKPSRRSWPVAHLSGPKDGPMEGPESEAGIAPEKGNLGDKRPGAGRGHCHTGHCRGMAGAPMQRRGLPGDGGEALQVWAGGMGWGGHWPPGLQWTPDHPEAALMLPSHAPRVLGLLLLATPRSFTRSSTSRYFREQHAPHSLTSPRAGVEPWLRSQPGWRTSSTYAGDWM